MNRIDYRQQWRRIAAPALSSRAGMSLVEVMVVIVIILTLMGVLAFGIFQIFGDAQTDMTKVSMSRVAQRVEIHMLRKGIPSNGDGLQEVFPDEVPKDAWGNDFVYVTPGPNGKKFDIISYGEDGQEGGDGNDADIRYSETAK